MATGRAFGSSRPFRAGWLTSWADPLRLDLRSPQGRRRNRRAVFAFAVLVAGLIVALIPVGADRKTLGELSDSSGRFVPSLCFMVGLLCLGTATWAAVAAARGRALERPIIAGLGVAVAALAGPCVRQVLQVVLLRDFYRPLLVFTGPSRAAAVVWGTLLALILVSGFLGPMAVAVANLLMLIPQRILLKLLPRGIKIGHINWLAGRRWWLVLPFVALAATVIITQWILPAPLATAMGYRYPAPSGAEVPVSLRVIGVHAWHSFQILAALPLLTGMWAGVEAARTCHRLVRNRSGTDSKLLTGARRLDYRLAAGLFAVGAVALIIIERNVLVVLAIPAAVGIVIIVVLSLAGGLRGMARMTTRFEHGVDRWQLPEEWRQMGPVSLVIAVLALPLLSLLAGQLYRGGEAVILFPVDASKFFLYWQDYGILGIPHATVTEVFGNVYSDAWVGCAAFALVFLFLIAGWEGVLKKQLRWGSWMLFRIAVLAFLLAPVVRLADHPYAMFLLVACVIPALFLAHRQYQPTLVWSTLLVGGALSVWSLVIFRTEWIPAAAVIGFTVLQRFVFNAGKELNTRDDRQGNRIAYLQAIALLSTGMLALGHGAANGYFQSDSWSVVGDRVALSVVAMLWLVLLINAQGLQQEKEAASTSGPAPPHPLFVIPSWHRRSLS